MLDLFTSHSPKLTSAEVGLLWTQYMNETSSTCFRLHMMEHIEDPDIQNVFQFAMSLTEKHLKKIEEFLGEEGFPTPIGFGKEDYTLKKPRIFSDVFCLHYLNIMSIYGVQGYGTAVTNSSRHDLLEYFTECNVSAIELCKRTKIILQNKGLYFRPPVISPADRPDFVQHKHFLEGWVGDQRPLSAIEITDIYFNLKKSILAKGITIAFGQISPSKDIRNFFLSAGRGMNKHIERFHDTLSKANLPSVPTFDAEITQSTESPFSDKLMLYHTGFLFSIALTYYGKSWAQSPRRDLAAQYAKAMTDDLKIAEECMNLMIKNAWLEQPPLTEDRTELSSKG